MAYLGLFQWGEGDIINNFLSHNNVRQCFQGCRKRISSTLHQDSDMASCKVYVHSKHMERRDLEASEQKCKQTTFKIFVKFINLYIHCEITTKFRTSDSYRLFGSYMRVYNHFDRRK